MFKLCTTTFRGNIESLHLQQKKFNYLLDCLKTGPSAHLCIKSRGFSVCNHFNRAVFIF